MLFDTPDEIRYAARLAHGSVGASAVAVLFPPTVSGNEKKQWNVFEGAPLSLRTDGLQQLKAKLKNLLAVKVAGYSMGLQLLNGNACVIIGSGNLPMMFRSSEE